MGGFGIWKEGCCDGINTCCFPSLLKTNCLSRDSMGSNYHQLNTHSRKRIGIQNAMAHTGSKMSWLFRFVPVGSALPQRGIAHLLSFSLFRCLMLIPVSFYKVLHKLKYEGVVSSQAGMNCCVCISALSLVLKVQESDFNQVLCQNGNKDQQISGLVKRSLTGT